MDDHSVDASPALVRAMAREDPRVRLMHNPGRGLVAALNHGLHACRCELVARMDADDLMHPERLAAHLNHFARDPGLVLSATQAELFSREEIQAGFREYMRWQNACLTHEQIARDLYIESPFAHPSVAFRRRAVLDAGGYREGPFPEDYDLWLRLFHAGRRMEKTPGRCCAGATIPGASPAPIRAAHAKPSTACGRTTWPGTPASWRTGKTSSSGAPAARPAAAPTTCWNRASAPGPGSTSTRARSATGWRRSPWWIPAGWRRTAAPSCWST